ncbi:membrane-associated proteins in eicosanoid and glutathione metabolism [Microstroma glucosiphilum]|uniref:Glutathione S-transferase 3, mitochondrial n=1 Tax=Pseudomicrostroma glucosiphilum TaxID=1684307 RepID=A0A316TWQ7_9BASI|nr:membrane-associated proteins in eicosanoid and glutathione metabolism [Pseudomicrostroma glucosiphilum]PWN17902.1 membrane-associated proteins in eicosanoid and glutathione metabolism [Pseudomicrostroma glucosiphilum]
MSNSVFDAFKPINVVLPYGFGFVGLAATGGLWLNFWQMFLVSKARKASGVKYPQMYASKEEQEKSKEALMFNCVQRAHQNTLENMPMYLTTLFLTGLRYPRLAVGFSSIWLVGRVLYTTGYASGDPSGRVTGAKVGAVGILGLLLSATWSTIAFITETGGKI